MQREIMSPEQKGVVESALAPADWQPTGTQVLAVAILVWGCELVLARISFDVQPLFDIVGSAIGLIGGTFLLFELMRRATPEEGRLRVYVAVALHLPVAVVVARLVGNALLNRGPGLGPILTMVVAGGVLVGGMLRARRGGRVIPSGFEIATGFALASMLALVMRAGGRVVAIDGTEAAAGIAAGLPPFTACLLVLALFAGLVSLCSRPLSLPIAAALVVAVGIWPRADVAPDWSASGPDSAQPDIFLVTVDTLRADTAATMKSYQRLHAAGVAFTSAQAPSPWTLPSLATVLTGQQPSGHGAVLLDRGGIAGIDPDVATLAEHLAESGYDTAAILSPNAFVSRTFGIDRGFAHVEYALDRTSYAVPVSATDPVARVLVPDLLTSAGFIGRRLFGDAKVLADSFAQVLDSRRDRPLFVWLHFLDCHLPYRHSDASDLSRRLQVQLSAGDGVELVREHVVGTDEARRVYDNEVRHIDQAIDRVLDTIDALPGDKLVVLTADHGEEFSDHGGFEHGHSLYDELVRVPLVIRGLGDREPGTSEDALVSLADIAPTLLAAAGLPSAGQNLDTPITPRRLTFWNLLYGDTQRYAVRDGDWKLISAPQGRSYLYNLRDDPAEKVDLAAARPDLVARLDVPPEKKPMRQAQTLSPAQENALRMLGYREER